MTEEEFKRKFPLLSGGLTEEKKKQIKELLYHLKDIMTEVDVKNKLDNGRAKVKKIVEEMTKLIVDAYQAGLETGMDIGGEFSFEEKVN